jgi:hypothetical protein
MKKSNTSGTKYDANSVITHPLSKPKYRLTRLNDGLVKQGDKVQYVIWKEDRSAEDMIDTPKIGTSLMLDPRFSYTWLTTAITKIVEQTDELLKFQTENSTYLLETLHD